MNIIKWFFMSKYKKVQHALQTQYHNKGGLWVETDRYWFRFDFKNMTIEVENKEKENADKD